MNSPSRTLAILIQITEATEASSEFDRAWVSPTGKVIYGSDDGDHHAALAIAYYKIPVGNSPADYQTASVAALKRMGDEGWARVTYDQFTKDDEGNKVIVSWSRSTLTSAQLTFLRNLKSNLGIPVDCSIGRGARWHRIE